MGPRSERTNRLQPRVLLIALGVLLALVAGARLADRLVPPLLANPPGAADRVVVYKARRELLLYGGQDVIARYRVSLGGNPAGPKRAEGDERTPEGAYRLDGRNARSRYHRSLRISYPAPVDRYASSQLGLHPGGDVMLHGMPNGLGWLSPVLRRVDWTAGCLAVSNTAIEEIWHAVADGTPIFIFP